MARPAPTDPSGAPGHMRLYDATYREFDLDARRRVRLETYGEDIGQNGWLTAEEWHTATGWLGVGEGSQVLDVACGSGGPSVDLARRTGATVVGVDVNGHAVETASELAAREGLGVLARFEQADAARPLPFAEGSFDASSASTRSTTCRTGRRCSLTGTACSGQAGRSCSRTRSS
jgi:SAM-dependent methyltransferase